MNPTEMQEIMDLNGGMPKFKKFTSKEGIHTVELTRVVGFNTIMFHVEVQEEDKALPYAEFAKGWIQRIPITTNPVTYKFQYLPITVVEANYIAQEPDTITADNVLPPLIDGQLRYVRTKLQPYNIIAITTAKGYDMEKVTVAGIYRAYPTEEFNKGWVCYDIDKPDRLFYLDAHHIETECEPVMFQPQIHKSVQNSLLSFSDKNPSSKPLDVTSITDAKAKIPDIVVFGNGDAWQLLGKASSKSGGWMKSSKAYEIEGVGCLVQVSTQQFNEVAEAIVFVPNVMVMTELDAENKCVGRRLVKYDANIESRVIGGSQTDAK